MEILKKEEKLFIVIDFNESEEIYEDYIEKRGYTLLKEWDIGDGKLELTLYKTDVK